MSFRKSPYTLLLYNSWTLVVYSVVASLLYFSPFRDAPIAWVYLIPLILFTLPHFVINFLGCLVFPSMYFMFGGANVPIWQIATLVTGGMLFGIFCCGLMHNSVHMNFRPKWLNKLVGEVCSLLQFVGYKEWKVSHLIHHKYPDDPENDPHPPKGLSYWNYFFFMKYRLVQNTEYHFYKLWGNTPKHKNIWNLAGLITLLATYLKTLTCFILMGPVVFVYFFIPMYILNVWATINLGYLVHLPNAAGVYETYDLNDTWHHKFVNFISFGGIFTKPII